MRDERILEVRQGDRKYLYATPNEHCAWRVKTIFSKEPDTIAWIESMQPGDILADVGANIGIYTVFAGVRGIKIYAFEPEAANYAILCKNIFINDLTAVAYCVALSDRTAVDRLYLSGYLPGGSCHSFAESVDHKLLPSDRKFIQGCIGMRLDEFHTQAHYVKIDVDGFEHKVLGGGEVTIRNAKSVLIEINQNLPEHRDVVEKMLEWGFRYDEEQVEKARRKEGAFLNCGNYIFTK